MNEKPSSTSHMDNNSVVDEFIDAYSKVEPVIRTDGNELRSTTEFQFRSCRAVVDVFMDLSGKNVLACRYSVTKSGKTRYIENGGFPKLNRHNLKHIIPTLFLPPAPAKPLNNRMLDKFREDLSPIFSKEKVDLVLRWVGNNTGYLKTHSGPPMITALLAIPDLLDDQYTPGILEVCNWFMSQIKSRNKSPDKTIISNYDISTIIMRGLNNQVSQPMIALIRYLDNAATPAEGTGLERGSYTAMLTYIVRGLLYIFNPEPAAKETTQQPKGKPQKYQKPQRNNRPNQPANNAKPDNKPAAPVKHEPRTPNGLVSMDALLPADFGKTPAAINKEEAAPVTEPEAVNIPAANDTTPESYPHYNANVIDNNMPSSAEQQ